MSAPEPVLDPADQITTRHATSADAPQLWAMMKQLADFEGYAAQFRVTERDLVERGLDPSSARQFSAIVAAGATGALLGYAVVHEIPFTYDLRPTLVLKELFVAEPMRSAGVGRAIMTAVLAHARAAGCARVKWDVLPTNERAKAFYRQLGGQPDAGWESWILHIP